jgi:hypothetical protein
VLWLRKLSSKCTKDKLVDAFQQWEGNVMAIVSDPISAGHTGQALIQLNSNATVCHAAAHLTETIVVMRALVVQSLRG